MRDSAFVVMNLKGSEESDGATCLHVTRDSTQADWFAFHGKTTL